MTFARHAYRIGLACSLMVISSGCASYVTPGRGADFAAVGVKPELRDPQTDFSIQEKLDRKPLASFPTGIAVVRLQASGYSSRTAHGFGGGAYSVVTTRDVERDDHIERLGKLPMVHGIAPLNRLLLPRQFESDKELRQAAAQLHADMLLIYTIDTTFYVREKATPLTVISLGLSPTKQARVISTASAVLMDTRSGYIYGLAEQTVRDNRTASAWTSDDAVDAARLKTEADAFEKLVGDLEKTWTGVVGRYAPAAAKADATLK